MEKNAGMGVGFVRIFLIVASLWCSAADNLAFSQVEYDAAGMRDPFEAQLPQKPAAQDAQKTEPPEEVNPPAIEVESLIAGGPVPQAIIKGSVFRAGDSIEEAKIISITKDGVDVLYHEKIFSYPAPSKLLKYGGGEHDGK